jgi:putative flippase GtrA
MEQITELIITKKQTLAKFIMVGLITTSIDFAISLFLYQFIHLGPSIASTISFTIAAFFNFSLNNSFTFNTNDRSYFQKMIVFYEIACGGLLINYTLISLLTQHSIDFLVSKIIVTSVVVIYNYFFQSKVTFK